MVTAKLKTFYCVAISQTLSTDHNYLFVGTNFGEVLVFSTQKFLDAASQDPSSTTKPDVAPLQVFQASEGQIYSLSYFNDFLIVGCNGEISGYSVKAGLIGKQSWQIRIPTTPENAELNEINFLWLDKDNGHVYAGCGDSNIYGINLEDGKILRNFTGHSDYIHSVDGNLAANQIASASEDGTVRCWDMRQKKATGKFEPYKKEQLNRPEFGRFQGTVSLCDDWLVCGGGPRLSLWHLRSNEVTSVLDFPGKVHVSQFLDDMILGAGDHKTLNQYNFSGDLLAEVPVSSSSVYSVTSSVDPTFLTIGGSSNLIDFCSKYTYRDLSVKIYGK